MEFKTTYHFLTSNWTPFRYPWRRESRSGWSEKHIFNFLYVVSKIYHLRTLESLKALLSQVFRSHPEVSLECPWSRLPVPLEARIELWLEREAHSQFSVRRLERSKIHHMRTLESLKTLFLQVFRSHPEVPLNLKLDTFPVPLEARIEPWLEREAHSQFSVRRLEISKIYNLRIVTISDNRSVPYFSRFFCFKI